MLGLFSVEVYLNSTGSGCVHAVPILLETC